jgi:hypothetical protein
MALILNGNPPNQPDPLGGYGSRRTSMSIRLLKWILLAPALVLLLRGHGFGAEDRYDVRRVPPLQPEQMRSQVNYDPKLADPFFQSEKWTYAHLEAEDVNGRTVYTRAQNPRGTSIFPRLKNTARLVGSHEGEHTIDFCHARLLDGDTIELFSHDEHSPFNDYLKIVVRNGVYWSQYWTYYKVARMYGTDLTTGDLIWTTKRQELTLDKQLYRKGDVIKGRIVFECIQEATHPKWIEDEGRNPRTIKVYGVFKTIVE